VQLRLFTVLSEFHTIIVWESIEFWRSKEFPDALLFLLLVLVVTVDVFLKIILSSYRPIGSKY